MRSLNSNESDKVGPSQLRGAMKEYKFRSPIIDSSTKIITFCADILDRPEAAGVGYFKSDNPRCTIAMMIAYVCTPSLKMLRKSTFKLSTEWIIIYVCLTNGLSQMSVHDKLLGIKKTGPNVKAARFQVRSQDSVLSLMFPGTLVAQKRKESKD